MHGCAGIKRSSSWLDIRRGLKGKKKKKGKFVETNFEGLSYRSRAYVFTFSYSTKERKRERSFLTLEDNRLAS